MITVITGLPGAGKTSWVIEQLLMPLAKKDWIENAIDKHGKPVQVKRRIKTNINGLLLDHDKIGEEEIKSWPDWAQPGDLIVYDEIQEPWPKVPAGSKKTPDIQQLEKHRHYGIDMVLLTQHPNLINDAIITLAGQHRHVRKVGNSRFATVYEWDGVSRSLLYKNAVVKKPWRRGKEVEGMYASSALHTKQARSLPSVLWVLLLVAIALPVGAYQWSGKFKERYFGGGPELASAASAPVPAVPFASLQSSAPVASAPLVVADVQAQAEPQIAGCVAAADRCECYDVKGKWMTTELQQCRTSAARGGVLVPYEIKSAYIASIPDVVTPLSPPDVAPVMAAFHDGHVKR